MQIIEGEEKLIALINKYHISFVKIDVLIYFIQYLEAMDQQQPNFLSVDVEYQHLKTLLPMVDQKMKSLSSIPQLQQCLKGIKKDKKIENSQDINTQIQAILLADNETETKDHWISMQTKRKYGWFNSKIKPRNRKNMEAIKNEEIIKLVRSAELSEAAKQKMATKFSQIVNDQLPDLGVDETFSMFSKRKTIEIVDLKDILKNVGIYLLVNQVQSNRKLNRKLSEMQKLDKQEQLLKRIYDEQNKNIKEIQEEDEINVLSISSITNQLNVSNKKRSKQDVKSQESQSQKCKQEMAL